MKKQYIGVLVTCSFLVQPEVILGAQKQQQQPLLEQKQQSIDVKPVSEMASSEGFAKKQRRSKRKMSDRRRAECKRQGRLALKIMGVILGIVAAVFIALPLFYCSLYLWAFMGFRLF
jgi:hypothetical protein